MLYLRLHYEQVGLSRCATQAVKRLESSCAGRWLGVRLCGLLQLVAAPGVTKCSDKMRAPSTPRNTTYTLRSIIVHRGMYV